MKSRPITESLQPVPITVMYHADCPDGFGAAFAAWKSFGAAARYLPMHHGMSWRDLSLEGNEIFILDFSFDRESLEEIAGIARSVTQIDHHASARANWATLLTCDEADGLERYSHPTLPLTVIFDLNKSGTRLAWKYFAANAPMPLALRHIEDIDLWRFAIPGTRAFCRTLRLIDFDFSTWDQMIAETADDTAPRYRAMIAEGEAIELFFQREVERLAKSRLVTPAILRGEPIDALQAIRHGQPTISVENQSWHAVGGLAINADAMFASELGNRLALRSGSFALIWQLAPDGEVKASLRAAGKVDVAAIATRYGGGGHPNAAGFRMPVGQFLSEVLEMVPRKGLEPPHLSAPEPKSGASTNFATWAGGAHSSTD